MGRTELEVFRLGLGGIPLMRMPEADARVVIDAARGGGINFAETAEGYGDSEQKLSWALRQGREDFVIASKSMERSAAGMARAIEQSLARLQTGYLDIYQLHSIKTEAELAEVFGPGGAMQALKDARREGKVRFIGISGHRPAVLKKCLETGEFDTVQVPLNVVDREAEPELLPYAAANDIGIIAMKPVCGGTLDDAALGIRFCLNTVADLVLVGMKSEAEVAANLETVRNFKPLSEDEEESLLFQASQLGEQFCRQCDYCQPCPNSVPIPRILWLSNYHRRYGERDPWTEEDYRALPVDATGCQECGECEQKCPYDLPIRNMLKESHRELAPGMQVAAKRKIKKAAKKVFSSRNRTAD
ncbi:MAG: aldo/keto reductase [Actinomycetota bacterium]